MNVTNVANVALIDVLQGYNATRYGTIRALARYDKVESGVMAYSMLPAGRGWFEMVQPSAAFVIQGL